MPKTPKDDAADSAGITIELARSGIASAPAPWIYEGTVTRHAEKIALSARIDADGAVDVTLQNADSIAGAENMQHAHESLRERVRLLLRACYRQAMSEGLGAPPRKIVRWREDRV